MCGIKYTRVKDDLIKHKCLCCNKNYQRKCNKDLKKRFVNTYKFSDNDMNKFFFYCSEKV